MLAITPFVLAWFYTAISLLNEDWNWIPMPNTITQTAEEICTYWGLFGIIVGSAACLAAAIYWNARLWMLRFLRKAICSIPFLNHAIGLSVGDDDPYWQYNPVTDAWEYESDKLSFLASLPLSIIRSIIKFVFNLIVAIGIPVVSPIIIALAMAYIPDLVNDSHVALLGVGAVMFVGTVFMYIIHPILSFKHD